MSVYLERSATDARPCDKERPTRRPEAADGHHGYSNIRVHRDNSPGAAATYRKVIAVYDLLTKSDLKKALDDFTLKVTIIAGFQMAIFIIAVLLIA
jgi:hypothetical protein